MSEYVARIEGHERSLALQDTTPPLPSHVGERGRLSWPTTVSQDSEICPASNRIRTRPTPISTSIKAQRVRSGGNLAAPFPSFPTRRIDTGNHRGGRGGPPSLRKDREMPDMGA